MGTDKMLIRLLGRKGLDEPIMFSPPDRSEIGPCPLGVEMRPPRQSLQHSLHKLAQIRHPLLVVLVNLLREIFFLFPFDRYSVNRE
jgi:hypothetical protein